MTRFQDHARKARGFHKTKMHSSFAGSASALRAAGQQGDKKQAQQRGAAVVEFALILPILLALLMGGIDASLAFYDKAVITNASREGARAGIVARRIPQTDLDIRAVVVGYTDKALINFAKTKIDPVVSVTQETVQGVAALRVSVTYTFHGIGLGHLIAQMGSPWVIQASTVMAYE
jgi:hypothetical protein